MIPKVAQDPRFRAGRTLVRQGKAGAAVDIFAALLEEARTSFGDDNIESAAAYYEYGNALLRFAASSEQDEENTKQKEEKEKPDKKLTPREAAAMAAEKRLLANDKKNSNDDDLEDSKTPAETSNSVEENKSDIEEEKEADDLGLALEMMETAWSIVDDYCGKAAEATSKRSNNNDDKLDYLEWATEQSPRYLTGIGDTLSTIGRHADAADAYSRALQHRLDILKKLEATQDNTETTNNNKIEHLKCRRLVVEANILIAEEFLACPEGQDVVTTETKDVLVKAAERVDYARGYYDKARDELQETVLLMGEMAAKGIDVAEEKEDICFVSTMVMGVGMKLAELDEIAEAANNAAASEPVKKKAKRK